MTSPAGSLQDPQTPAPGLTITCDDGQLAPAVVRLTAEQAWQFAQFLKRSSWETYARHATTKAETEEMVNAAIALRRCINEVGFDPR